MDEDEDVTEEMLTQEVDWWSKPGAPIRPELRSSMEMARAAASTPIVESTQKAAEQDDVMEIEPTTEVPQTTDENPTNEEPMDVTETATEPVASELASPPAADTDMPDAQPSPVRPTDIQTAKSPSIGARSAQSPLTNAKSPTPKEEAAVSEPATIADLLASAKSSPPSNPLAQAEEVAAGLAIETPSEQVENSMDPGSLSGAGGGIAGEGIVGSGSMDLGDSEEPNLPEERTGEEEKILEESKKDLEMEVVNDV
jgi:hypothetical protein